MRKILLVIPILGLLSITSFGQTTSCTQTLRLAQSTYEQGRLHEVPTILKNCIDNNGFSTQEELVQAYKILINSYIYLEEPELADATMLKLLQADHYFKPNDAVDPAEFIALYKTFRVNPLFRFGFKIGPTATMPAFMESYGVNSNSIGNGKFGPKINLSFGLVFEKDFPNFLPGLLKKNFSIAPELVYVLRAYNYTNSKLNYTDQNPDNVAISQDQNLMSQSWLDLNLLVQYKFKDTNLNPYISIGPSISHLLSSSNEIRTLVDGQGAITGPAIDTKTSYKPQAFSAIIAVGSKYRFGGFYLTGDIRYQVGLNNIVNESKRTNSEAAFVYGYVPPNYRQNNLTINIGIVFPYFKPMKLTNK